MSEPSFVDGPNCRGDWTLGTACGKCHKCNVTRPSTRAPSSADRFPQGVYVGSSYVKQLSVGDRVELRGMAAPGHVQAFSYDSTGQVREYEVLFTNGVRGWFPRNDLEYKPSVSVHDAHPPKMRPSPPPSRYETGPVNYILFTLTFGVVSAVTMIVVAVLAELFP